ncbi:MAG: amino acid ABC transporter permease [Mycobacterium leprae]
MSDFIQYSLHILPVLLESLKFTLSLTIISAVIGTVIGLLAALARISKSRVLQMITGGYINLFRGTPLMLQILFFYAALPQLGITLSDFSSVAVAFSLNAGAYIAEIIRGAIQSVDKGQMEAARSLGMSYNQAMRRVILPQTFRRMLPPMVNELAALTKDTSLAMVAGIMELMKVSQHLQASTFKVAQTYVWTGVIYLIITMTLTSVAGRLEKKLEARG